MFNRIFFIVITILINLAFIQKVSLAQSKLFQKLSQLPGIEITEMKADTIYNEMYKIMLTQPIDHKNPEAGTFQQRIFLRHYGFERPVVMITDGYQTSYYNMDELALMLKANEMWIEYRYFGESAPDTMDWQYLNTDQSSADYHRILTLFQSIYPKENKWVNIGWSKGGQTALIYKHDYPNDIDVIIAYDAPLNFELEEKRIDDFFDEVGTPECRQKLIDFQRMVLKNKDNILPLFKWYVKGKGYEYSIGYEKALEYCVLEYPFSFWQYTEANCKGIPGNDASPDEVLDHLRDVVSFSSYSDKSMNSPSMYQFSTELGYYGYVQKNVKDLLSSDSYPNYDYAPEGSHLKYSNEKMIKVNEYLQNNGNNIIYIYAKNDPWSAPHFMPIEGKTNALFMMLEGGNHFTYINTFPTEQRSKIIDTLEEWLEMEIE